MYLTLFGTPSGFAARTYGRPLFEVDDRWIDSRNELPLDDTEWAVMVSRRQCAQGLLTWIGLYRPAHEIHVSRGGQYGAGLWLLNQAAPGPEAFALLTAVADEVARLALANGKFTRSFDAFEPEIRWPDAEGAAVRGALRPVTQAGVGIGDKPMLLMDASAPGDSASCGLLIDVAQGGAGLGGYQRIVIADLPRVVRQIRALSQPMTTTPASWQREAEASTESGARRLQADLQAALTDADAARKDLAALRERLSTEHRRAMDAQAATLQAAFDQQMQQAQGRLDFLEPALQKANVDLEAAVLAEQRAQANQLLQAQQIHDLQADARDSFRLSHRAELTRHADEIQLLKAQLDNSQAELADAQTKRSEADQNNQSLRSSLQQCHQQINEDAESHRQELARLRTAQDVELEALRSDRRTAQDQLDAANRTSASQQEDLAFLRQQLRQMESGAALPWQPPMVPAAAAQGVCAPAASRARFLHLTWPSSLSSSLSRWRALGAGLTVLIVICVCWAIFSGWHAPPAHVPAPRSTGVVDPPLPDCAAGWQAGAEAARPAISVPLGESRAAVAETIWNTACRADRPPTCQLHDQGEIERQLDSNAAPAGAARWTFKIALAQGCRLAAASAWEWSAGVLLPQRAYLEQPTPAKKGASEAGAAAEKPAKVAAGKTTPQRADAAKAGQVKADALKSDAIKADVARPAPPGAAAAARTTAGGGGLGASAAVGAEPRPASAAGTPAPAAAPADAGRGGVDPGR